MQVTVAASGSATALPRAGGGGGARPPYDRNDFWRSPLALVLVSLIGGGSGGLALLALFSPARPAPAGERLAMFVSPPSSGEARSGKPLGGLVPAPRARGLSRLRGWSAFEEELDIARLIDPCSGSPPPRSSRRCSSPGSWPRRPGAAARPPRGDRRPDRRQGGRPGACRQAERRALRRSSSPTTSR